MRNVPAATCSSAPVIAAGDRVARDVRSALAASGHPCVAVTADTDALDAACRRRPCAVIVEAGSVAELQRRCDVIRAGGRAVPVVVLANPSSEALAIEAIRCGVADYVAPPFDPVLIAQRVKQLLQRRAVPTSGDDGVVPRLIGPSTALQRVHEFIAAVAATNANVLITGETGTGKELVAQSLHQASTRRHRRLVSINCPAIPDALFESELFGHERGAFTGASSDAEGRLQHADGGTVLFDEVADLTLGAQAKLLRTIEASEIARLGRQSTIRLDLRFLSATNADLGRLADEGRFRRDLYYRLKVCHIQLPPLRERVVDIPPLLDHYLRRFAPADGSIEGFSEDALSALMQYPWPGNVRELRNAVESLVPFVRGPRIGIDDLPSEIRCAAAGTASVDERARILAALTGCAWNKRQAARTLRWSRMTLYRKLAKHGIDGHGGRTARSMSRDMHEDCVTRARR